MSEWWSASQAGWIGGLAGGAVGILGAVFGTLAWRLIPRGKGKTAMISLVVCMIAAGVATLSVGFTGLALRQPYHVWYPLVLCGGLTAAVFGGNLPGILSRYRQAEARRLEAESLRRS